MGLLRKSDARPFVLVGLRHVTEGSGRRERRGLFNLVNRDRNMRDALTVWTLDEMAKENAAAPDGDGTDPAPSPAPSQDGPFVRIVKWMIENPEKVIAFIKAMLTAFGVAAASVTMNAEALPSFVKLPIDIEGIASALGELEAIRDRAATLFDKFGGLLKSVAA